MRELPMIVMDVGLGEKRYYHVLYMPDSKRPVASTTITNLLIQVHAAGYDAVILSDGSNDHLLLLQLELPLKEWEIDSRIAWIYNEDEYVREEEHDGTCHEPPVRI